MYIYTPTNVYYEYFRQIVNNMISYGFLRHGYFTSCLLLLYLSLLPQLESPFCAISPVRALYPANPIAVAPLLPPLQWSPSTLLISVVTPGCVLTSEDVDHQMRETMWCLFSGSGLLHLILSSLASSIYLQISCFYFSLQLNSTPQCSSTFSLHVHQFKDIQVVSVF